MHDLPFVDHAILSTAYVIIARSHECAKIHLLATASISPAAEVSVLVRCSVMLVQISTICGGIYANQDRRARSLRKAPCTGYKRC
jgi:hypothetical protein